MANPMASEKGIDPITFQVIKASLSGVVQEMQNSLFRTGYSTIIRESQDASCALLNAQGEVVAQHVVLPLHVGAFPACTAAVLRTYGGTFQEGDAFLINHPYEGGSPHAPDMAVITPVFARGRHVAFCATIAHKSDIGGPVPGSCFALAKEIFAEGLHLPALRFVRAGQVNAEIEYIIAANSRTPELVLGDIRGQLGSDRLGEQRIVELCEKYGEDQLLLCFDQLMRVSEKALREYIAGWPDGRFEAERLLDNDGISIDRRVRVHVVLEKKGDRIRFDYSGSDDQTQGPANIRPPLVRASIVYCLICLTDPHVHINSGLMRVPDIELREGSVLNPRFPAALNTYNPTVHAVVEATLDALAQMVPGRARGDGCGSRSIVIGGRSTRAGKGYVQYEIFGGGTGARPTKDGMSGACAHQSNSKIASVEIIESEFPTLIKRFDLVKDSGGPGQFRGGLGIHREYENLAQARFNIRSTKHIFPALGVHGGRSGRPGKLTMKPGTPDEEVLPSRYSDYPLAEHDVFRIETPGGGGFGDPFQREPQRVVSDVNEGYVSPDRAAADYGVVVVERDNDWVLDEAATRERRARSG